MIQFGETLFTFLLSQFRVMQRGHRNGLLGILGVHECWHFRHSIDGRINSGFFFMLSVYIGGIMPSSFFLTQKETPQPSTRTKTRGCVGVSDAGTHRWSGGSEALLNGF